ncbi:MAG: nucleoside-diphosphate sugar epimerase/dehydratase [Thermoanaerobaculia bacterium]
MSETNGRTVAGGGVGRGWRKFLSRRVQVAMDVCAIAAAFSLAYVFRFDFAIPPSYVHGLLVQLPWVIVIQVACLVAFGIYNLIWRYVGLAELRRFVAASVAGAVPLLLGRLAFPDVLADFRVPVSITLMTAAFGFGGVLGLRVLRRIVYERFERESTARDRRRQVRKPVLLVGAGRAGVLAVREIFGRGDVDIEVKGFVDDDTEKVGSVIGDVRVLGTAEEIPRLVRELGIDHVVITIAKGSRADILRIVEICDRVPVKVRIVPGLYDILQGRVATNPIRDVEIEDLLGREPVKLDAEALQGFLGGKTVMVTGAGGSIGSELARQAARYDPGRLLLVERSEPFLFQVEQEMKRHFPATEVVPLIADVGDEDRMRQVFVKYRPEVVLHAAAHKHVPMMEGNPCEAVKNNVLGTRLLGQVAAEAEVETFVLISTDKAVNPSSVMGASKRVAELVVQTLEEKHETKFVAVRFGNVLGSTGSVIPIFKEQIRRGGPVTVTHPRMTRYFMTIPEAAQLVLQAGAIGEGGEIFILDMGDPVRIIDVARDMIRLSGLRPDEDVEIQITGLRPGEKLFEELATTDDRVEKTRHPKIFVGKIPRMTPAHVEAGVEALVAAARRGDGDEVRRAFRELVPEAKLGPGNGGKPEPDTDELPPEVVEAARAGAGEGAKVIPLRKGHRGKQAGAK